MHIPDIMDGLTEEALMNLRTLMKDFAWPEAPVRAIVADTLKTFFRDVNHCDSCESSMYRQGKADAINEVINDLRSRAGDLFADRQDNEAGYLRDMITPLRHAWNAEIKQVEYLNMNSHHTCTLDGSKRDRL